MPTIQFRNSARAAIVALCLLPLAACSNMDATQQRVLSGAAIGAGTGIATYAITGGCVTCGAVIGTAVGAGAGYAIDVMNR